MNNEETLLDYEEQPKQENEPKQENAPKAQLKKDHTTGKMAAAAAAGAVVGSGATFAGQAVAANTTETADATADAAAATETPQNADATAATVDTTPKVAIVDETKDFTTAFNGARDEVGPGGVFEYHGKLYHTYTDDEWNKMSAEDQSSFAEEVRPMATKVEANYEANVQDVEVHHVTPEVHVVNASPATEATAQPASNEVQAQVEEQPQTADNEIHVLGVEHNVEVNGHTVDVAQIEVGGHQGLLVDVDQDGTANIGVVDVNDNGQIDPGEAGNITDAGLPMPGSDPGDQYMSAANDMPDYTNDAALV